jgi:hypothetical protein
LTAAAPAGLALVACPMLAGAQCLFNDFGDITNPGDPSCRDVQLSYTRDDNAGNNIALGFDVPLPVDSLTAVDGFRSYQSLHEQHQALDALSAGITGVVVGQSAAGRDIWAYQIGDLDDRKADGTAEGAVLVNGTIHAREWQSPEAVTEVFEQLTEIADDGGFGQYLHESLNVVLLPVLNVDGFLQTQRFPARTTASELQPRDGRMRRKNMRHPSSGGTVDEDIDQTGDNFYGVDLNRNNPNGFGQNGGSSTSVASLVYRGPQPQSEPEIDALLAAAELGPANRLRMYTDAHSFSRIFLAPIIGDARRDLITRDLVNTMRSVLNNKYRYGGSTGFIGTTADYFARTLRIPSWTLEIEPLNPGDFGTDHGHSGFILPDSEVARMRDEIAAMLLAGFYAQTDKPALRGARIRDAVTGEIRYDAAWVSDGEARRLDVATNRALLPGRSYRLWLGFNKPMRWRNGQGLVANYRGLSVPIFPDIELQFPTLPATSDQALSGDAASWRADTGEDGTIRYSDDALATDFTVPASTPVAMVIAVDALDITGARLDADPATPVAWSSGHWIGYEDVNGTVGDLGGTDCNFAAFVASDPASPAPAVPGGCRQTATNPPTTPPPAGGSGGGGGAALWWLPLLSLAALVRRRRC